MRINNPLGKFGLKDIVSVFSMRQDGNMSLCYGDTRESLENRKKFLSAVDIDYRDLICAKQVHGKNIAYVTQADKGRGALDYDSSISDTDGFLTDKKNLPIAILTADCLSVFVYDTTRPAAGILHAGWRGTEKNICSQGIRLMQEKFGSKPDELLVGFGPSIRSCCCKMDNDFKSNFPFGLINRDGSVYMDIALINTKQLVDCGVKQDNIFDPELCTLSQNEDFFSFRKEAQGAGRMISVIMLR
ncbi:MAG: peptidoglycan editing factor PgeF [Candidatus Omnitrophica bacterium]|nr:peptidoglycan editing factor PgeF [Candidatus Omnitrophota bacterium]